MRLIVAAIGRLKAGAERELAERYRDRVAKAGRAVGLREIEIVEIRESRAAETARRVLEESIALANIIPDRAVVVALDSGGDNDSVTSRRLSAELDSLRRSGFAAAHPKEYCEREWVLTRRQLVGRLTDTLKLGIRPCDMPNEWPVNVDRHINYSIASIAKLRFDRENLRQLTMPVLTVHGTRDRNAPYGGGREWASILPNARLVAIRGGAHQSFDEYPEIVLPAIETFLRGSWPGNAEKVTSLIP